MSALGAVGSLLARRALPGVAGLPAGSRVLDIGGGTGSWFVALAEADRELTATVFELPDVAAVAEERLRTSGTTSPRTPAAGRTDHPRHRRGGPTFEANVPTCRAGGAPFR
jgi:hypothetical protein